MLKSANIADHYPIYFIDPKTQNFLIPHSGNLLHIQDNKTYPVHAYIPFIITGERKYYEQLKANFLYHRFKISPKYQKKGLRYYNPFYIKDYIALRKSTAFFSAIHNDREKDINLTDYLQKDWSFLNQYIILSH